MVSSSQKSLQGKKAGRMSTRPAKRMSATTIILYSLAFGWLVLSMKSLFLVAKLSKNDQANPTNANVDLATAPVDDLKSKEKTTTTTTAKAHLTRLPDVDVVSIARSKMQPFLQIPTSTTFCLVHVGKTAGSRLCCELGLAMFGLYCKGPKPHPSALKDAFAARTHMLDPEKACKKKNVTSFVYTLRNPLDRLISWYFYEHARSRSYSQPKRYRAEKNSCANKEFHKWENNTNGCFDSLDDFAMNSVLPTNITSSKKSRCQLLAFQVARGEKLCDYHNAMGYVFYENRLKELSQANRTYLMLGIRTEHLADDWDRLEQAFGGHGSVNGSVRFQTRSGTVRSKNVDSEVSDEGKANLCFALCEEIQVYKKFLNMAQNFNESQVRESIAEVIAVCPKETYEIRECPSPAHMGVY
jgi:hypothetical protein